MNDILIFSSSIAARAEYISGIREFAAKTDWELHVFESDSLAFPVKELISFWKPIGCIFEGSGIRTNLKPIRATSFGNIPVICLGNEQQTSPRGTSRIFHDPSKLAALAAKHLIANEPASYAFVGIRNKDWSRRRQSAFIHALALNGKVAETIEISPPTSPESWKQSALFSNWLTRLEKPCGLFAANDQTAELVLSICHRSEISVPHDIAVIGTDNDESICFHTRPTLTSVHPDFRQGGRCAAQMLARRILAPKSPAYESTFSGAILVIRGSTRIIRRRDNAVSTALERIHAPDGTKLSPAEILSEFDCSRRNAEIRFRRATGHSVLDELIKTRIELAERLLLQTDLPISTIAERCGYRHLTTFRDMFRTAKGILPLAYRKERR